MDNEIKVSQDNLGLLMICAERYAMGRKTYMPSTIAQLISGYAKALTDNDLTVLKRDLDYALENHIENDDLKAWQALYERIGVELIKRGK